MPLIKNANSAGLIKSAVVLDLGDLDRQAKRIVEQAREQAKTIRDEAKQKADALVAGADAKGYEQGMQRGLTEGKELGRREGREELLDELRPQLEQLIQSWADALNQWDAQRGEMLLSAREDVLAFAVAMAEKIVFRTIEADDSIIEDQLAESLALLSKPSNVAIRINPQDRDLVEEVLPELLRATTDCRHATITDDPTMTRGGCIVRTIGGEVDATIETQLDRIVEAILPWTCESVQQVEEPID